MKVQRLRSEMRFIQEMDNDLRECLVCGLAIWNLDQADHYQQLISMLVGLSERPLHGKFEAMIIESLRSYPSGLH